MIKILALSKKQDLNLAEVREVMDEIMQGIGAIRAIYKKE